MKQAMWKELRPAEGRGRGLNSQEPYVNSVHFVTATQGELKLFVRNRPKIETPC